MTAIDFKPEHHSMVCSWWSGHGWPAIGLDQLPKQGTIVFKAEKPICAAWLYSTDSRLNLLEWVVSNPATTFEERGPALDMLFETLLSKAKPGALVVGFSTNDHLTERYKEHGFALGDAKLDCLVKPILGGNI